VSEVLTDRPDGLPVEPADSVAEHDAMWRALAGISDRQRAVLVLRHYEGLDDGAIAAALGCRRSSVRSLATRGLAALRESPHIREAAGRDAADTRRKP
jgi:RNA polymerase sigma factor (sigma-70 family)